MAIVLAICSSVISVTGIEVPSFLVQVCFFGFFAFAINPRPIVVQSTFSPILNLAFVPLRETTYEYRQTGSRHRRSDETPCNSSRSPRSEEHTSELQSPC